MEKLKTFALSGGWGASHAVELFLLKLLCARGRQPSALDKGQGLATSQKETLQSKFFCCDSFRNVSQEQQSLFCAVHNDTVVN